VLKAVCEAADLLAARGLSVRVLSVPTVKPLDEEAIGQAADETALLCVVEEHGVVGGLSDAVARCLVGQRMCNVRFLTLDTEALITHPVVGSQSYLMARSGLSPNHISDLIVTWMRELSGARG